MGINGEWVPATNYGSKDQGNIDIAVIGVNSKADIKCISIARANPPLGTTLRIHGYAPELLSGGRRGNPKVRIWLTRYENTGPNNWAIFAKGMQPRTGDSGGLVSFNNELVGIISGGRINEVVATGVAPIRAFLQERLPSFPVCGKKESYPVPPKEESPKPKPVEIVKPDTSKFEAAIRKLVLQNAGLKIQIAKLNARLDNIPGNHEVIGREEIKITFVNDLNNPTWRVDAIFKDGVYTVVMPDYIVQTTKSDGKTPTDEKNFPFGTPIRLKSEIPISALKRALEEK